MQIAIIASLKFVTLFLRKIFYESINTVEDVVLNEDLGHKGRIDTILVPLIHFDVN